MSQQNINDNSFLGTGWSFPPTFDRDTSQVQMVPDQIDVLQSIQIILSTQPGERTLQPGFGCDLSQFLFAQVSQNLVTSIRGVITDALLFHEPRIDVNEVNIIESEAQDGLLHINIDYTIRSTNTRYNMFYPFYINEGSDVLL